MKFERTYTESYNITRLAKFCNFIAGVDTMDTTKKSIGSSLSRCSDRRIPRIGAIDTILESTLLVAPVCSSLRVYLHVDIL